MGLIVAGAASTGGLAAALAVKLSRKKNADGEMVPNSNENRLSRFEKTKEE
jgi:hypothetical protein